MPEVMWVWDYERRDLGSWPTDYKGHNKPTPILTLDQIEAWLRKARLKADLEAENNGYESAIDDLLDQVQAWRKGGQ